MSHEGPAGIYEREDLRAYIHLLDTRGAHRFEETSVRVPIPEAAILGLEIDDDYQVAWINFTYRAVRRATENEPPSVPLVSRRWPETFLATGLVGGRYSFETAQELASADSLPPFTESWLERYIKHNTGARQAFIKDEDTNFRFQVTQKLKPWTTEELVINALKMAPWLRDYYQQWGYDVDALLKPAT